jgi:hypothetical protein
MVGLRNMTTAESIDIIEYVIILIFALTCFYYYNPLDLSTLINNYKKLQITLFYVEKTHL